MTWFKFYFSYYWYENIKFTKKLEWKLYLPSGIIILFDSDVSTYLKETLLFGINGGKSVYYYENQ